MQKKINKFIYILLALLLLILSVYIIYQESHRKKEVARNFFYMDTYIYIKLYEEPKNIEEIWSQIDNIYKKYHQLTDRYHEYEGIHNLYFITYNTLHDEYIEIDKELISILNYGIEAYKTSHGLLDITMGNVLDIWKSYRDSEIGIPTKEELEMVHTSHIEDIILKDNQIYNNHVNIDLGAIAKGYATEKVKEYLEKIGIQKYLINAGGNVVVGDTYKKEPYQIGLENPDNVEDVYKIIHATNKVITTSGGYSRYYEFEGQKYHHIINPNTLFPTNYMKSVSVITDNSIEGDILSTILFLMPVEEGKKLVESKKNVEAIWLLNDNQIETSSGFNQYE